MGYTDDNGSLKTVTNVNEMMPDEFPLFCVHTIASIISMTRMVLEDDFVHMARSEGRWVVIDGHDDVIGTGDMEYMAAVKALEYCNDK